MMTSPKSGIMPIDPYKEIPEDMHRSALNAAFEGGNINVSIRFTTYFLEVFENIWDKIWRN